MKIGSVIARGSICRLKPERDDGPSSSIGLKPTPPDTPASGHTMATRDPPEGSGVDPSLSGGIGDGRTRVEGRSHRSHAAYDEQEITAGLGITRYERPKGERRHKEGCRSPVITKRNGKFLTRLGDDGGGYFRL